MTYQLLLGVASTGFIKAAQVKYASATGYIDSTLYMGVIDHFEAGKANGIDATLFFDIESGA